MRLLVSVRDADEAAIALAGGADIIDAKEPSLGPLAPVAPRVLQDICAAVPAGVPLSVALGDAHPDELGGIIAAVAPMQRRRTLYFKAAIVSASPSGARAGIANAAELLRDRADAPALIVARYVDAPADAADLGDWIDVCAASGARGLLLDTSRKDSGNLLTSVDAYSLASFRRRAARRGIWLALAGGMTIEAMDELGAIRPHVVGVRGAVCDGSRTGLMSMARVTQLRRALDGVIARAEQASPA